MDNIKLEKQEQNYGHKKILIVDDNKLNIKVDSKHYNNHKCYIQSWIRILEDNPNELFKAINEANKVFDYLDKNSVIKIKDKER